MGLVAASRWNGVVAPGTFHGEFILCETSCPVAQGCESVTGFW